MSAGCLTCRFRDITVAEDDDTPVMECHRFPPITLALDDGLVRLYPQISEDDWCGEHEEAADV